MSVLRGVDQGDLPGAKRSEVASSHVCVSWGGWKGGRPACFFISTWSGQQPSWTFLWWLSTPEMAKGKPPSLLRPSPRIEASHRSA